MLKKTNKCVAKYLELKKKDTILLKKYVFFFDTIETDDKFIKQQLLVGCNDVKFLLARGKKSINLSSTKNIYILFKFFQNEEMKKAEVCNVVFLKKEWKKGHDDGDQNVIYGAENFKL